jgi:hypothetical protein
MSKITLKKVDGELQATATVQFSLGKVYQEQVSEDGKRHTIIAGMDIDGMERYYKQLLKEGTKKDYIEQFENRLEQYVMLRINQMIGIKQSPPQIDEDGKLKGIEDDVEVEVIE